MIGWCPSRRTGVAVNPKTNLAFTLLHDPLERKRGNMMAFIDDYVAIVGDDVVDDTLAHEALHDGDVDNTSRRPLARAEGPDRSFVDLQEG